MTLVQLLRRRWESLGRRPCIPGTPPTNSGLFSSSDTKLTTLDSWTTWSAPSTERAPVIPSLTRLMECHWLSQRELGGRYSTTVGAAPLSKTSLTYIYSTATRRGGLSVYRMSCMRYGQTVVLTHHTIHQLQHQVVWVDRTGRVEEKTRARRSAEVKGH